MEIWNEQSGLNTNEDVVFEETFYVVALIDESAIKHLCKEKCRASVFDMALTNIANLNFTHPPPSMFFCQTTNKFLYY